MLQLAAGVANDTIMAETIKGIQYPHLEKGRGRDVVAAESNFFSGR